MGVSALAAVGVTSTVTWLVNSPLWAFGTGFLACVARDMGAGDRAHARRTAAQAVKVALILGAVMTAIFVAAAPIIPGLMKADPAIRRDASIFFGVICIPLIPRALLILLGGVLRGAGDTRTPMVVNVALNVLNIALNFLLIYPTRVVSAFGHPITVWGANLGVTGTAIATAISFTFGGIAMTFMLFRHEGISPRGESFRLDGEIMRPCLKITLPNAAQRLVACFGQVTFASMVNSLGQIATTAHSTAITAESAFYIPGYGMQAAASALMGNACGAGDKGRMRSLSRTLLILVFCLMIVTGGLLFLLAGNVMRIFTADADVVRLGTTVLRMVAVSEPVFGLAIILEGIFQGVGDTLYPFIIDAACMWGVRILGTYITVVRLGMGLPAAWAFMIAHNACLAIFMAIRYRGGKWNPLSRA